MAGESRRGSGPSSLRAVVDERLRAGGPGRRPAGGLGRRAGPARGRRAASCSSASTSTRWRARRGGVGDGGATADGDGDGQRASIEPIGDLPTALAAAIVDPGRIEVRGADGIADLEPWLAAQPAVGASLLADDPRPRRGTPLALAVAGPDGRVVAADGAEAADALRHLLETLGLPLVGHEVKPILVARFADDPAPGDAGRVRHPDRGLHPQRRAAQPDDRRRRRREPRPDPAAGDGAAGHGPGRPRGAVGARRPRAARAAPRRRRSSTACSARSSCR